MEISSEWFAQMPDELRSQVIAFGVPKNGRLQINTAEFNRLAQSARVAQASRLTFHASRGEQPSVISSPIALPIKQWPAWAQALNLVRAPEDAGVGDTVHREAGRAGLLFSVMFKMLTGQDCQCADRRKSFNLRFPY